jgi:bifunctional N-acetylglucosamine-1-phosphate-uridyltransferase/glucosamine-1-phosphate-acetyltransferase GlmU-like protein
VGTGDNVLFAGFFIQGNASKTLLIRSAGPSLTSFGVPGALGNPQLELHDASNTIGTNDNWQTTQLGGVVTSDQVAAIQNSGATPLDPAEPALIATLPAGGYTAIVQGVGGAQGVATVEVYDLSPNNGAILANLSTRGFIQTGDNVMIGGFIVVGQSSKVLIRATGPSLVSFGINNALANPRLELHDANGTLAGNDDWQTTQLGGIINSDQSAAIQNSGLAPRDPAESAIIATLAPGNYTAIAQGVDGGTGVGLIEVFALP